MYLLSRNLLLCATSKCANSHKGIVGLRPPVWYNSRFHYVLANTYRSQQQQQQQQIRPITQTNSCLFRSSEQPCQKSNPTTTPKSTSTSLVDRSRLADDRVSTRVSGAKRAKQAASDVSYTTIIAIGGLALVATFYYLFSELFSRETPTGIYDESAKICIRNPQIIDAFGQPIKVSAESGGRRVFQIRQKYFVENGLVCLIINYYLEGPRNKGDVIVKVKKNEENGKFEYDYIVVKLEQPYRGQYKINVKPEL